MVLAQVAAAVGANMGRIHVVQVSTDPIELQGMVQQLFVPDPLGHVRFYNTLEAAYAACTSNANDVILLSGNGSHAVSTGIAWSKNRIHVIGMDGGGRLTDQGAKVSLSGAVDSAYVVYVTGTRNTFKNVKFIQSSTHANALTVVQDGAEGTVYENCSFIFGVVNNLGGTTAHEFLAGSDSATYKDCQFGADTLLTSAARSVFHIKSLNGFEFKSNILRNCRFIISSSSSTATFVRLDTTSDILFSNTFEDCIFIASVDSAGGAAVAEASQTGTGTVKGCLCYVRPSAFNVTDFATATSGRNAATQVVAFVSVAAAIEGIKPTA